MRLPNPLGFFLLVFWIPASLADDAKDDSKLLDGRWKGVSLELDGRKAPEESLKEGGWVIKGLEVEFFGPGTGDGSKASIKLDSGKTPKHFDLVGLEGPQKGKKMEGIFKIEKDKLFICLRNPDAAEKGRPTEFKTEAGSGLGLVVLERAKE